MLRRRFVTKMVLGASIAVLGGAAPAFARACSASGPSLWQITRRRTDLPQIFFDGFRVTDAGVMHAATWDGQRKLLGVAQDIALPEAQAEAFRALVDAKMPGLFGGGGAPSGRGPYFEVGRLSQRNSRSGVVSPEDAELSALTDALASQVTLAPPEAGHYIWTKPVSAARPVDLDLRDSDCDDPIALAIAQGVTTGRMILPADDGYQGYFSGPFEARVEFGARLGGGYLGYGVLGT